MKIQREYFINGQTVGVDTVFMDAQPDDYEITPYEHQDMRWVNLPSGSVIVRDDDVIVVQHSVVMAPIEPITPEVDLSPAFGSFIFGLIVGVLGGMVAIEVFLK